MPATRPLLEEDGQASSGSPLHIGQIINGKYRIERQIGRGGMGIVLAATHLQLEHLVAIKVMRRDLVMDDRALDRLLLEARSAARIRSEHVARVLDVGTLDNGSAFIVMEYLDGENLADLLDREGALEVEQATSFLMQCCLALAEVHVAEMVHRDLKPGNLFIARLPDGSPMVKIVDFGISKQIGSAREGAATTSPQVLGSPFYMSPEQMRADPVDERSDIWGLGAILFEMLTGRPPFIGDTLPEVYSAVLNDPPPNIDSLRAGVPVGLDDVVQRCLEKDPAQRFCDVADLAEALAPYAGSAAQAVERITRILTNPDPVRARYSLLPGSGVAGGQGLSAAGSRDMPGGGSSSGILGSEQRVEGMMVGEGGDGADGGNDRRSAPGGAPRPLGATVLESGAGDERPVDGVWNPSRPPLSAEYSALVETGVRSGRAPRLNRKRVGWLLAGAGLGVIGFFGIRAAITPRPGAARPPNPEVLAVPVVSAPRPAPLEPRVTPIVVEPSVSAPEPEPRREAAPPVTRTQALQPAPRAKPEATSASAPSGRGASAGSSSAAPLPPMDDEADLPPPRAVAPGRAAPVQGDDPWNPNAFGDRR
jgi:serine/threonine protein kinase